MYEENPYPRYKHADHTNAHFAKPTAEFISLETTIANPSFTNELLQPNSSPKILIAGCGTGNQVINASRYKNAEITAIDISNNSLSYAARKSQEYRMHNVQLQQLDILDANCFQIATTLLNAAVFCITCKIRPEGWQHSTANSSQAAISRLVFTANLPDGKSLQHES